MSTLELQCTARIGELHDQKADLLKLPNTTERHRLLVRIGGHIDKAHEQLRQLDRRAGRFKPDPPGGIKVGAGGHKNPDTPPEIRDELARRNAEWKATDPAGYAEAEHLFGSAPDPGTFEDLFDGVPTSPERPCAPADGPGADSPTPDAPAPAIVDVSDPDDPASGLTGAAQLAALSPERIAAARRRNALGVSTSDPDFSF